MKRENFEKAKALIDRAKDVEYLIKKPARERRLVLRA